MQDKKIIITAMGHFHPEHKIANSFFEDLDIGTSGDWITERTGIESRASVLSKEQIKELRHKQTSYPNLLNAKEHDSIADMGEKSWEILLKQLNSSEPNLDLLICGTSIPDYAIPANAATIAERIKQECAVFDVNSACSSFIVDLHVARSLMRSTSDYNLCAIFNVERYSTRMNYEDRSSCILFGDGSTATLLSGGADALGLEIIDTIVDSSPKGFEHVKIPEAGLFSQNGSAVQKFAITKTCSITNEIMERNNLSPEDINYFVGHQANLRMLNSSIKKLGLTDKQHLYNIDRFGNQGGAGAPAVLSENWSRFKKGDHIVVSVVGSGLTWASALLRKT